MTVATARHQTAVACAKVNLYLHVTGRRGDGYHTLDSLFVRTALGDRLTLTPQVADQLVLTGPFAAALAGEPAADNLALAAVRAVRNRLGGPHGIRVDLDKQVPVAAGLGGGSADAAAALQAMAMLAGGVHDNAELAVLAAGLGADVPACLRHEPLAVSGIGEVLQAAPALPPCALVLVNPGVPLATADVFGSFDGKVSQAMPLAGPPADFDALTAMLAERRNDLERAAIGLVPGIAEVLARLGGLPGVSLARMSGSGATCFGLVRDLDGARAAAAEVRRRHPSWWVAATAVISSSGDLL